MHTYTHVVFLVMIALYAISIPMTIASVGQPRKPFTPGTAATIVVMNIAMLFALTLAVGHGV